MTRSNEPGELIARHWHDVVMAVGRVQRLIDAELEVAGVPPQWHSALALLLDAEGHRLPMSTLARELAMTSGGFSKLADRMAAEGLIDRRGTADDRRVVHATLTDEGLTLARKAQDAFVAAMRRRLLPATDAGELEKVATILAALAAEHAKEGSDVTQDVTEDVAEDVIRERDPALPDRRGRGRTSG